MTSCIRGCRLSSVNVLRSAVLIAALALVGPAPVCAQEATLPVPDAPYAPSDHSAPGDVAVPMPDIDPGGDGSVVTVPIPGGGNVTVEGPDLQNEPARSPIETWGVNQIAPNSITGNSPLGPGLH